MTTFAPRDYPIMELAIALDSKPQEQIQEGDIAAMRRPDIGIGLAEANLYLWLLVEGYEHYEWRGLTWPIYEPFDPTGEYDGSGYTRYDKRRYSIPLARLQQVFPALDLVAARDPAQAYQPFYTIDTDNNLWLTDSTPFDIAGLVFDKENGVYL